MKDDLRAVRGILCGVLAGIACWAFAYSIYRIFA